MYGLTAYVKTVYCRVSFFSKWRKTAQSFWGTQLAVNRTVGLRGDGSGGELVTLSPALLVQEGEG
jgi:hypothetical protein